MLCCSMQLCSRWMAWRLRSRGVHHIQCFGWRDTNKVRRSKVVRDAMSMVRAASTDDELDTEHLRAAKLAETVVAIFSLLLILNLFGAP